MTRNQVKARIEELTQNVATLEDGPTRKAMASLIHHLLRLDGDMNDHLLRLETLRDETIRASQMMVDEGAVWDVAGRCRHVQESEDAIKHRMEIVRTLEQVLKSV